MSANSSSGKKPPIPPTKKSAVKDLAAVKVSPELIDPQKQMVQSVRKQEVDEDTVDFSSRDEVMKAYLFLVQMIAANITGSGKIPPNLSFDDLVSYGTSGLIKAWENFEKDKGVKFKVYASYRVRGEILDKIRKEWKYQNPGGYKSVQGSRAGRKVAQAALDAKNDNKEENEEDRIKNVALNTSVAYLLSFEEQSSGGGGVSGEGSMDEQVISNIDFAKDKKALWDAVKTLDDDEKQIVKMFYIDDMNQKDIADALGYSKSKVSRMHAAVLSKLRVRLKRVLGDED